MVIRLCKNAHHYRTLLLLDQIGVLLWMPHVMYVYLCEWVLSEESTLHYSILHDADQHNPYIDILHYHLDMFYVYTLRVVG